MKIKGFLICTSQIVMDGLGRLAEFCKESLSNTGKAQHDVRDVDY